MPTPKEVLEYCRQHEVKIVDLRFTDLPGLWHHISFPISQLTEAAFEDGFGIDGSSIRGWAAIHESDMLLIPDPSWFMLDGFTAAPTLVMIGDIQDPLTRQRYD
ncbi:MAG: glutamine synthetase, partial [Terriglobales bacterium]